MANQLSGDISGYAIDAASGALTSLGAPLPVNTNAIFIVTTGTLK